MSDYIPSRDPDFSLWVQTFSNGISANPALFMMTAGEAASIKATVDDFVAKLLIASADGTRTKQSIADKDDSRSICESLCRQYAMIIKDLAGITDGDKIAIGVRPINPDREPIEVPTTPPLLNILGNLPGTQTLRYADTTTPDSAAKPFGASELQLFVAISDVENAPLSEAQFLGKYTRNPVEVSFTEADDGKFAVYYGRWASPRGDVGPFSLPVAMRIAA